MKGEKQMQNIELTSIEAKEAMKEDRRVEHNRFAVVSGLRWNSDRKFGKGVMGL